jgi:hypothetical protein
LGVKELKIYSDDAIKLNINNDGKKSKVNDEDEDDFMK